MVPSRVLHSLFWPSRADPGCEAPEQKGQLEQLTQLEGSAADLVSAHSRGTGRDSFAAPGGRARKQGCVAL